MSHVDESQEGHRHAVLPQTCHPASLGFFVTQKEGLGPDIPSGSRFRESKIPSKLWARVSSLQQRHPAQVLNGRDLQEETRRSGEWRVCSWDWGEGGYVGLGGRWLGLFMPDTGKGSLKLCLT